MAKKEPTENKIDLPSLFRAASRKDRKWYDNLSEHDKKIFSPWMVMRFMSSITGDPDLMRYYVMSINETTNKDFSSLQNHPKLQYLLMTAASPNMGTQRHTWINPPAGAGRKKVTNTTKLLRKLYPTVKDYELELLNKMNDEESIVKHLMELGWTDKEIKTALHE